MTWLFYKVTVFYGSQSASGIACCETNALKTAIQQIPAGAVLTGRMTKRIAIDEDQHKRIGSFKHPESRR